MKQNYSIDEILNAIKDLHKNKEEEIKIQDNIINNKNTPSIPKEALRIIEEAEKIKKN